MKVRVLLFAGLREKAGTGELALNLEDGSPLTVLREQLKIEPSIWSSLAFAVNQTYVPAATVLHGGDEVALIPPVAGG